MDESDRWNPVGTFHTGTTMFRPAGFLQPHYYLSYINKYAHMLTLDVLTLQAAGRPAV